MEKGFEITNQNGNSAMIEGWLGHCRRSEMEA